jgi:hypothetical protein
LIHSLCRRLRPAPRVLLLSPHGDSLLQPVLGRTCIGCTRSLAVSQYPILVLVGVTREPGTDATARLARLGAGNRSQERV